MNKRMNLASGILLAATNECLPRLSGLGREVIFEFSYSVFINFRGYHLHVRGGESRRCGRVVLEGGGSFNFQIFEEERK